MSAPIGRKQVETEFAKEHKVSPQGKSSHGMVPSQTLYNPKAPLDFDASKGFQDPSSTKVKNLVRKYGI
jgi:hypothetical protein